MEIVKAREISESEIDQIHVLVRQLSSRANLIGTAEINTLLSDGKLVLFTAIVDGKIIGMLSLVFYQIPTGLRARIEDVVVLDEYRGLGIARSMSEKAISTFKEAGARTLDLTSSPSRSAANNLYQSIGLFSVRQMYTASKTTDGTDHDEDDDGWHHRFRPSGIVRKGTLIVA